MGCLVGVSSGLVLRGLPEGCLSNIDGGVELPGVGHFDPLICGGDDDGGGVSDADTSGEHAVCLYLIGAAAVGVEDEGHLLAVRLEPGTRESEEVVAAADAGLTGEDIAAEVFGEFRGYVIFEIAGVDGGCAGPGVTGDDVVVVNAGDAVVVHRGVDDGRGEAAERALEVFELDDGQLGSGRRFECRGVFKGSCAGRGHRHLGCQWKRREERESEDDEALHS